MKQNELLNQVTSGDAAWQKNLYKQLLGSCMSLCLRYIDNQHDAEDCMMNGFFKFFRKLPELNFENDRALLSYMGGIMVNECLKFLEKKKKKKKGLLRMVAELFENDVAVDEEALDNMATDDLHDIIRQLPENAGTVFNLHIIEGWPHQEIGKVLNITPKTSMSHLSKAKVQLQKIILSIRENDERQFKK